MPVVPAGFERPPLGKLLSQYLDMSSPMGVAYERAIGFEKPFHVHDRHMLVFPRNATRMEVRREDNKRAFCVDSTRALWVPHDVSHDDEGTSAIYDTLAL